VEKIWLKQYQQGVPETISADEHSSLVELFEQSCKTYKDKVAFSNLGSEMSYGELDTLSLNFASFLQNDLGLKKGERVAIMMPNLLQYTVALFGILRAGLVAVNTNPLYTADELTHQINDSGAQTIVVLANFAHTVEQALPNMQLKHVIVTQLGDLFSVAKKIIVNAVVKYIKKMVPHYTIANEISFCNALKKGESHPFTPVDITHEDIAFLQYTGGTTGVSKGAILTHHNMVSNVLQASAWVTPLFDESGEIIITALPLYHIFSLTANCLTFLKVGAKNILITNPRDIPAFIDEIKNVKFTAITGVNTLFNALLHHEKFEEVDFSKLKLALSGGMALQKSVALHWKKITKSSILEAYGLTETSPAATMNPMYLSEYSGSIGVPIPSTDISVRDDDGKELPLGEEGELCIKGPQVMQGYWQRPDETEKVFWEDGFLRTGDVARIDEKGFVYLVDRKKDMIIVSGFNVYPNEIEQVITMHPDVLEAGVIGITDEHSGERVKACIVRKSEGLTKEDIIAHCREHLTAYKIPKDIEFHDELPKTNIGKILRRALKEPA
jgi:long-chain acyl-CoA synthetase